ncbi:MAG: class I SAM-dependent methyltransferase [Phycisphaerae bacterium]
MEKLRKKYPGFFRYPNRPKVLKQAITEALGDPNGKRVLEVGGIDRPQLSKDQGYSYVGLDIESREGCYRCYDHFYVQSVEEDIPGGPYDLIISNAVLEHVPNNDASFRSMYNALKEGGRCVHYVPSKWHPYAICLRLVGPERQKRLVKALRPYALDTTGYPAFFHHCSIPGMRRLAKHHGFKNIRFTRFYRGNDYFAFFLPAFLAITSLENLASRSGTDAMASGFVITMEK